MAKDTKIQKRGKIVVSKKTKKWFAITAPDVFDKKEIGHTLALDGSRIIGRMITLPMTNVTGNFADFDTSGIFRIIRAGADSAETEYAGQQLMEDKISRLIQKWSSRIDTITDITSTDNRKIRIKLITITSERVKVSLKRSIRANVDETVKDILKDKNFDAIVKDFIDKKFTNTLKSRAAKLYPLKSVELRKVEVE